MLSARYNPTMSEGEYELTPQEFELAQTYASLVVTGIQIARVLKHEYTIRHISHVHTVSAHILRIIYQERKKHEPFNGDELSIIDHPALVVNTADALEDAALEVGILLELQRMGRDIDVADSLPVSDEYKQRHQHIINF